MTKKKVLVVDDSAFIRSFITRQIDADDRLELLDVAKDGVEAVEKVCKLKPDVMTLDVEMPRQSGLQALAQIMEKCPTRIVMVSSLTKEGALETMKALEMGAIDFFPKSMDDADTSIFTKGDILAEKIFNAANVPNIAKMSSNSSAPSVRQNQPRHKSAPAPEKTPPPQKTRPQPGSQLRFKKAEVVIIGISTGGPKALHSIISDFPNVLRAPVLIIQHMPPNFTGAMANRMNQLSQLNVVEAEDGMELKSNYIYIAPGGTQCEVVSKAGRKVFKIAQENTVSLYKPSVEIAANSLHNAYGGNVVGVMMTGMGHDGIDAFKQLKASGAYVIAQNQETCIVYGMPKAVVDAGIANEVLPLAEIPSTLERLLS